MDRKWFQFQTGSIKSILQEEYAMVLNEFQFQTGSIRSVLKLGKLIQGYEFQFQTGSIRRLSEYCINIILYPYSSCQVNFYFDQIRGQFAVDL